ncbi:hypothetical protein D3C78_1833040 [compost metagenome]
MENLFTTVRRAIRPEEIKRYAALIEGHIRDGGSWDAMFGNGFVQIELKINGDTVTTLRLTGYPSNE